MVRLLAFTALFVFAALSNRFDWDHFFTSTETDLRSWLLDGRPPLWSYQLCAGVTRIGDPQAFGLSPLFIFPAIFGSFWGLKVLILVLAITGHYFTVRILKLINRVLWAREDNSLNQHIELISILFTLGNFFLWHINHGHIPFTLTYLCLPIVYFALKGFVEGLKAKHFVAATLAVWFLFSAGFYHASMFFLLPLFVSFLVAIPFVLIYLRSNENRKTFFKRAASVAAFIATGLLLSSYKWLAVINYQNQFPRSFSDRPLEFGNPLKIFVYQFIPTIGNFWNPLSLGDYWGIWEYSSFSFISWLFVGLFFCGWFSKRSSFPPESMYAKKIFFCFFGIYLGVLILFSLGDSTSFSLFALLNRFLLQDSLRVIGRYQIGISFCLAVFLSVLLRWKFYENQRVTTRLMFVCLLLAILNMLTFYSFIFPAHFNLVRKFESQSEQIMTQVSKTKHRIYYGSYMYEPVLQGYGVANCYDPLNREQVFMGEFPPLKEDDFLVYPFVDTENEECRQKSYFTQSEIVLDSSCGRGTCLNLNSLNMYSSVSRFVFDPEKKRYCLR